MIGVKIMNKIKDPPVDVTNHFDKLYQLEEVPSTLVQVGIPTWIPITHNF